MAIRGGGLFLPAGSFNTNSGSNRRDAPRQAPDVVIAPIGGAEERSASVMVVKATRELHILGPDMIIPPVRIRANQDEK